MMLDALKKYEVGTWKCWGTKRAGIWLSREVWPMLRREAER